MQNVNNIVKEIETYLNEENEHTSNQDTVDYKNMFKGAPVKLQKALNEEVAIHEECDEMIAKERLLCYHEHQNEQCVALH